MPRRLVALDSETTGLDPRIDDVFEIAVVDIDTDEEAVWRVAPRHTAVEHMHPMAAQVNRYHERVADPSWWWDETETVLGDLRGWLSGAHIVGAVPDFDTRFLAALYERFGSEPPRWHYHLIDVEALAIGWLVREPLTAGERAKLTLPWDSDELSRIVGVASPDERERHTALGDARWARDMWKAVVGATFDVEVEA